MNPTTPSCAAIIVAAGRGSRFGDQKPKQYAHLNGMSILRHALIAFDTHPRISTVQPVIHPDDHALFSEAAKDLAIAHPVDGGATRQESVWRGLEALKAQNPDIVLVHDGARPNIQSHVIDQVIDAVAGGAAGVIPALPVPETLKRLSPDGSVKETVPRENVVRAQTPQGFIFEALLEAHRSFESLSLTDDAAIMEEAGHTVRTVVGSPDNIKITEARDLTLMSQMLSETRTGMGFDVHRLGPGIEVILGGVAIPFDRALIGHTDADVVPHAATDAILGALSEKDIGFHFPPNDIAHKGKPSATFLRFAISLLQQQGGSMTHLDLTVICERPKISEHRDAMRRSISDIAGVPENRVSVKATTTEGLGFTGRGEGIACQAIATISLPLRTD